MVAACIVHSSRAPAAHRRSALARVLSGLHHFPAHRRLVLVVYSRTRHFVCVFRQPHLARLHRGAGVASAPRFSIGRSARGGVSRWRGWCFTTSAAGERSIRWRWSFAHFAAHAHFVSCSRSEISSTDTQRHFTRWSASSLGSLEFSDMTLSCRGHR